MSRRKYDLNRMRAEIDEDLGEGSTPGRKPVLSQEEIETMRKRKRQDKKKAGR